MRKVLLTCVSLLLAMTVFQTAHAATTGSSTASVTVNGGAIDVITPPSNTTFAPVTLSGATVTTNANLSNLVVSDSRGSGAGWNVTVQASQFTTGTNTIPLGSLRLNGIVSPIVNTNGSASPVPTVQTGNPWTIDNGSAVKIVSAALNAGMGQYNISFPANALSLSVLPDTFSGTYTSTLTWTIVTGP